MFNVDYNTIIENFYNDFVGENLILVLRGHKGYDDTICHYSNMKNYEIRSTGTVDEILNIQNTINNGFFDKKINQDPYYTIYGCIDLDKFNMKPIGVNEQHPLIKAYKDYIVYCGGTKYAIANSCEGKCGGYFVYPNVQAYLPTVEYDVAQIIFKKYVKVYRKLNKIQKIFE